MIAEISFLIIATALISLVFYYRSKWTTSVKELEMEKQKLEEQKGFFEKLQANSKESFQALAGDVLDQNNQRFLQLAIDKLEKKNMEAAFEFDKKNKSFFDMVKPIQELMDNMQKDLKEVEKFRGEQFGELKESISQVRDVNEKLRLETSTLSSALKRPEVRGSWGEIQLKRVVELAGMNSYCDFEEQVSQKGENGLYKPDLVVYLPNERSIIVDAKAVMDAYLDAMEEKNSDQRKIHLKKHATNLRARVRELAKKSYWEQFEKSPDFVVLFVPNEALLAAAVEVDRALIEDALVDSVVIATPTTLVSLLKAVAYGWQQEKVQQNAKEIVATAKEFYQRLVPWLKKLDDTGNKLEGAVKSYNASIGSLESRVLPNIRKMKEMSFPDREELSELHPIESALRTPQIPDDNA